MATYKVELRREKLPAMNAFGAGAPSLSERFADELAKIKADPGEWYRLASYERVASAGSAASLLRKQRPDFSFARRKNVVYARYDGDHGDVVS